MQKGESVNEEHYRKLENMYLSAPCNKYYAPQLRISEGRAELVIEARQDLHHAGGAVHGAAYFKAIDDAAFFAASSLVEDVFVLTANLNCYLTRPIVSGEMRAAGRVVSRTKSTFLAETVITDSEGNEIGRGMGSFVHSQTRLSDVPGYRL